MSGAAPCPIAVDRSGRFTLGGEAFVIDTARTGRRRSDDTAFTIVKSRPYLNFYANLARTVHASGILELGVFEGGGYVFIDRLFDPDRMAAVDIRPDPIPALDAYCARHRGRHVRYGASQTDAALLREVVEKDLDGALDVVIDDASHAYDETRASFDVLFPLLRPGGLYVIEDWAWAHHPAYQSESGPRGGQTALTTLLFEQIALMGSTAHIAEIRVLKPLYVIRKAAKAGQLSSETLWTGLRMRGRSIAPL
jgi:predicted O-methyltransferase YrrM